MNASTHMTWMGRLPTVVVLASAWLSMVACGGASLPSSNRGVENRQGFTHESPCQPRRVAVLIDKTGSAARNLVAAPVERDFDTVIAALRRCGGHLGVGAVRERASAPLLRLSVPREPAPPACAGRFERDEPASPMIEGEHRETCRVLTRQYHVALAAYEQELSAALAAFLGRLRPLLAEPANRRATDLWSAVAQANTFLHEPVRPAPSTFLIVVGDGEHNTATAHVAPRADTLVVVNGFGKPGALGSRAESFGDLGAAFNSLHRN